MDLCFVTGHKDTEKKRIRGNLYVIFYHEGTFLGIRGKI